MSYFSRNMLTQHELRPLVGSVLLNPRRNWFRRVKSIAREVIPCDL